MNSAARVTLCVLNITVYFAMNYMDHPSSVPFVHNLEAYHSQLGVNHPVCPPWPVWCCQENKCVGHKLYNTCDCNQGCAEFPMCRLLFFQRKSSLVQVVIVWIPPPQNVINVRQSMDPCKYEPKRSKQNVKGNGIIKRNKVPQRSLPAEIACNVVVLISRVNETSSTSILRYASIKNNKDRAKFTLASILKFQFSLALIPAIPWTLYMNL